MTTRERLKHWYDDQKAALLAEGAKQGREEGLERGLEKGRAEGQRSLLAKQLKLKFGQLDAAAEAKLAGGTVAQLGRWAERVLTAGSLDEIWA